MNQPERIMIRCPWCGKSAGEVTYVAGVQEIECSNLHGEWSRRTMGFYVAISHDGRVMTYRHASDIPKEFGYISNS